MGLADRPPSVVGDGGDESDDPSGVNRHTARRQTTRGPTQSESQMSVASSQPASQLIPSQTDIDSQESAAQPRRSATANGHPTISPARFTTFRTAMGQLMGTAIFQHDSADFHPLLEAVNGRIGGEESFHREEAAAALAEMASRNDVM